MASFEQAFEAEIQNLDNLDKPRQVDQILGGTSTSLVITFPTGSGGGGNDSPADPSPKDSVVIDDTNVPKNGVFLVESDTQDTTFTYEAFDGASIGLVGWYARRDGQPNYEEIAASPPTEGVPEPPFISVNHTAAVLSLGSLRSDQRFGFWQEQQMVLQIGWRKDSEEGSTDSRLFSVVENEERRQEVEKKLGTASTTPTSSRPTLAPGSGLPESSPSTVSSDKGGGGGGLATGAIAGIAVGAVIGGLLLIGALVWFLLRRRRQNRELKSGYNGQQSSGTYMVDKETHGRVTETPTSPYSDDNQGQPVPLHDIDMAREGSTTRNNQPGFAPYQDAPRRPSLGSQGDRASGTQTPQGVSSNVAHLVEDGMTADEIRRLEEEERQLDDEIERAARR